MLIREPARKGDFSTNSSQISTLQRDRRYSQSGRSCHFSLSLHSQRIPGWGWPEEAAAPTPPANHTDRKTNTFTTEPLCRVQHSASPDSHFPWLWQCHHLQKGFSSFPSLPHLQSLSHPGVNVAGVLVVFDY